MKVNKFFSVNWYYRNKPTTPKKGDLVKYDKRRHVLFVQRYRKKKKKWVLLKVDNKDSGYRIREKDQSKPPKYIILIYTHRHAERLHDKEKGKDHIRWYELKGLSD